MLNNVNYVQYPVSHVLHVMLRSISINTIRWDYTSLVIILKRHARLSGNERVVFTSHVNRCSLWKRLTCNVHGTNDGLFTANALKSSSPCREKITPHYGGSEDQNLHMWISPALGSLKPSGMSFLQYVLLNAVYTVFPFWAMLGFGSICSEMIESSERFQGVSFSWRKSSTPLFCT